MTGDRPLDAPVTALDGVGPARAAALLEVGVTTIGDLLRFYPRTYRVIPAVIPVADAKAGEVVSIRGLVTGSHRTSGRRRGPGHLKVSLRDGSGRATATFYNQGFLKSKLERGASVRITGTVRATGPVDLAPFSWELGGVEHDDVVRLEAIYAAVAGLQPGALQRIVADTVRAWTGVIEETLGSALRRSRGLASLAEAVRDLHLPADVEAARRAHERLLYDGFLAAALAAEAGRRMAGGAEMSARVEVRVDDALDRRIRDRFPFAFTPGQDDAVRLIGRDLAAGRPMRRLLQGDVGSGKTAVAAWAVMATIARGGQVAVLTPTDALARQFHAALEAWCESEPALLVGAMPAAAAAEVRERLGSGETAVVVGTHALLSEDVRFDRLALVVVDEQHRFGVMQRLELVRKGPSPHLLAMSATPIPRTLAMTVHSDLDVAVIAGRPPGRAGVETEVLLAQRVDWAEVAARARTERTFIVFPAIDSDDEATPSLLREGRSLARRYFRGIPVAALHGRMRPEEKNDALEDFRSGVVQVLFTTTVIEVGVDVPEATWMIIMAAPRFGLAQLHQLRGRVGRGGRPGRCSLVAASRDEADTARLDVLLGTDDGFEIAERDLELRGPGDIMGLRQHGAGSASVDADEERLLADAFEDAREILDRGDVDGLGLAGTLAAWSRKTAAASKEYLDAG